MPAFNSPIALTIARTSRHSATRLATGRSSAVMWLCVRDVEKPIAPAFSASCVSAHIFFRSSSLAASLNARSPITYVRSAE